jgi:hypothetical protein
VSGISRVLPQPILPPRVRPPHDVEEALRPLYATNEQVWQYLSVQQAYLDGLYGGLARSLNDRHMVGLAADRPTAGEEGRQYFTTDTTPKAFQVDDGSTWQSLPLWSVPLATTLGGTGLTSYTTGDVLYASGTNVLAKLAKGSSGYVLQQGASIPAWFNLFGTANTWTAAQTLYSSGLKINNPANTYAYTVVGSAITAARSLTLPLTTQAETLAVQPNVVTGTAASPTGTTSSSYVMMGLAIYITPTVTGRLKVSLAGFAKNGTAGSGCRFAVRYGTGTAPTNGSASVGSTMGLALDATSDAANSALPFCADGMMTGLTLGTQYWIDVSLLRLTSGTATLSNLTYTAIEL